MLTQEKLKRDLHYDPLTGIFTWLVCRGGGSPPVGSIAGTFDRKGYILISLNNPRKHYRAHRLAWLYVNGEWPKDQIDHKNGIKADNRFDNLREATNSFNIQNERVPRKNNKIGMLGVYPSGNGFCAKITTLGKACYLGYYKTPELAHAAYIDAKRKLHKSCTI